MKRNICILFSFLLLTGVQLLPSYPSGPGLTDRLIAREIITPLTGQALEEARAAHRASELAWEESRRAAAIAKAREERVERRGFLASIVVPSILTVVSLTALETIKKNIIYEK